MISKKSRQQSSLREVLRAKRRQLTGFDRIDKTHVLIKQILRHHAYQTAKHIAFYAAFDGEVDIAPLLLHAYNNNKHCYLPVMPKFSGQRLRFAPYSPGVAEKLNRFGISEPVYRTGTVCSASKLDLVLMPLVGFDTSGQRLGMGGGYYDRCFEFRRNRSYWKTPLLLGVAFECQKVDTLASQPWDVAMDACITEKKGYEF